MHMFNIKEFFGRIDKKAKIITAACAAIVIIAAVVVFAFVANRNTEKAYAETIETCIDSMLNSAVKAEKLCNLAHDVWYNTIFEKSDEKTDKYTKVGGIFRSDFNDALSDLYSSTETKQTLSQLESTSEYVERTYKELKNPPASYKDTYEEFEELCDCYFDFIDFAKSPSGSLTSYTENLSQYDSAFVKQYEKTMREIPEQ